MILADTVIWADHLARGDPLLEDLLQRGSVVIHPFVIGEIALGSLRNRENILAELGKLPAADIASVDEVIALVALHRLHGTGIGYVDAHLLASCRLSQASLWTRDKRLHAAAERLGVAARVAN